MTAQAIIELCVLVCKKNFSIASTTAFKNNAR